MSDITPICTLSDKMEGEIRSSGRCCSISNMKDGSKALSPTLVISTFPSSVFRLYSRAFVDSLGQKSPINQSSSYGANL